MVNNHEYSTIVCNQFYFDSLEEKVRFKVLDEALPPSEEVIGKFYCYLGNTEEFYYSQDDSLFQPVNAKQEYILGRLQNCYNEAKRQKKL